MGPQSEEMLTTWLNRVLRSENVNILKFDFPNIQFTGGYVSKMINSRVTVKRNGKTEVLDILIKSGQSTPDDIFTEAYLNEINVYSRIVPYFNIFAEEHKTEKFENIPYCYGVSVEDGYFASILDNLKPKGFQVRDFAPLDIKHLRLLLVAFAKWHAFSIALKDQKPEVFNKLIKPNMGLEEFKIMDLIALSFEQQMDFAISLYEGKNKPAVLERLKSLRANYRILFRQFLKNENEECVVICHADVWNNNFMFKYNEESVPTEVRIVDWQTAVIGSPSIDIAQLFFFCCCREEIEEMDDLLKLYHTTASEKIRYLGSDPEKCFPWEGCLKSFKRYAPLAIAGVPFLVRMYFSERFMDESDNVHTEPREDGDFSAVLGEKISDQDAFFERMNSILELCIERDLF